MDNSKKPLKINDIVNAKLIEAINDGTLSPVEAAQKVNEAFREAKRVAGIFTADPIREAVAAAEKSLTDMAEFDGGHFEIHTFKEYTEMVYRGLTFAITPEGYENWAKYAESITTESRGEESETRIVFAK